MKLTDDLTSPQLIHAKGGLFLTLGFLAAGLLIAQMPRWETIALLVVTVCAFCRFYYYLFYVLERHLGREQRFAGVVDALRYLLRAPRNAAPNRMLPERPDRSK